jgi:hypothetical protein
VPPLSYRPRRGGLVGIASQAEMTASKLAGIKRQQAAALQSHIINYGVVTGSCAAFHIWGVD